MKEIFAIGVGGSGAKCIEALIHLHACSLLSDPDGTAARLGVFLVEPDQQSALLARAQTAISRYTAMRKAIGRGAEHFASGELRDYGHWSPLSTSTAAVSLEQIFSKASLRTQAPGLAALFDCLFPPEEQQADLEVGFRGRPPIGSAIMSRVDLEQESQGGQWQQMLGDIQTAAGQGEPPVIHLFGSVFGGTGASGVPTLGQLLKNWLVRQGLKVQVQASLLLPYFEFDGMADADTGVHAEARSFQMNTDAALRYLSVSGKACFDRVYLVGSDIQTTYQFSIGGVSQSNAAHLLELLAALGLRHPIGNGDSYANVLSRSQHRAVSWEDLPDDEVVGAELARAVRFALAWRNNISREIDDAQKVPIRTFLAGAPWARRFFDATGTSAGGGGRPGIREKDQITVQISINQYCETFLQWFNQISTNLGTGFQQQMVTPSQLVPGDTWINDLSRVIQGKARPKPNDADDTVEAIKVTIDRLPEEAISHPGMAGLADSLWKHLA